LVAALTAELLQQGQKLRQVQLREEQRRIDESVWAALAARSDFSW
jgi:hypothetical protein